MLSLAVTEKKSHFDVQGLFFSLSPPDSIEERSLANTVDIIDGGPECGAELDNVQDCLVTMGAVGTGLVQHRDVGVGQLPTKMESGVGDRSQQILNITVADLLICCSQFSPLKREDSVAQWQRGPGTS